MHMKYTRHFSVGFTSALGILLLGLISLSGCSREESLLFEKPSTDRMLDQAALCEKTLLANPNGWQMDYVLPENDSDLTGSYRFQLQFHANKEVTIWADFLDKPVVSTYKMSLVAGPTLSFDSYGALTELANPANNPTSDIVKEDGYFGENDFMIVSVSPEKIVLRGVKYGKDGKSDVVLTPLKEPASLTNAHLADGIYRLQQFGTSRALQLGEKVIAKVVFVLPESQRFLSSVHHDPLKLQLLKTVTKKAEDGSEVEDEVVDKEYEFTFTHEGKGIHLATPIEYAGKSYSDFVYDEAGKRLTAVDNDQFFINLQTLSPLTLALTVPGEKYCIPKSLFYAVGMSPMAEQFMSKEACSKIFKGYVELQLYNQPNLKSFTFFHKPNGENSWQNILFSGIKVIDDAKGIYLFEFSDLEGDDLQAALGASGINPVLVLAVYFTSLGKNGAVQIAERAEGGIRVTSVAEPNLWIDFAFDTW